MSKHYAFVDGMVIESDSWRELTRSLRVGTPTFSPRDSSMTWCRIVGEYGKWAFLPAEEVPPEFKLQLLLLGVRHEDAYT